MNKRVWILSLTTLIASFCMVSAQSKEEKKEKEEQQAVVLKELIDSKNYKIKVDMAYPRRGTSIPLTSDYSLEIKNDSVFSFLPYYGRAYSVPYGGGDGLRFEAPITEYRASYSKKGKVQINITTRNPEDQFKFNITVYLNGSSNINVNMLNRESISFVGDINMED